MQLLPDGTRQISIGREQFEAINAILNGFYKQTKCGIIMLSDVSGLAVALKGTLNQQKMSLLSTLAAGNYAATGEIARLLDEDNAFSGQFHEGKSQSIYLKGINDEFFLTVVFGKHTTFGMVRVLVDKVIDQLAGILDQVPEVPSEFETVQSRPSAIPAEMESGDFQAELSSRLDAILGKIG